MDGENGTVAAFTRYAASCAFNALAVSRKGAEGIAQFMPATADVRGLSDPFDPIAALEAASCLADLKKQFGNPGMGIALRTMIRIADDNRSYLENFCNKLIAAGGACVVLRNQFPRAAAVVN